VYFLEICFEKLSVGILKSFGGQKKMPAGTTLGSAVLEGRDASYNNFYIIF
jgi:hypothetical protein